MNIVGLFVVTMVTFVSLFVLARVVGVQEDDPPVWFWIWKSAFHRHD